MRVLAYILGVLELCIDLPFELWDQLRMRRRRAPLEREATCLYCRCSDSRACIDDGSPCRWDVVDRKIGAGVCSRCAPRATGAFIPGVMRCAKCGLRLVCTNLYAQDGTFGPGGIKSGPCPNGCGPLWPVTWESETRECWQRLEALQEKLADEP